MIYIKSNLKINVNYSVQNIEKNSKFSLILSLKAFQFHLMTAISRNCNCTANYKKYNTNNYLFALNLLVTKLLNVNDIKIVKSKLVEIGIHGYTLLLWHTI